MFVGARRALIFDVDGVMTDGRLFLGSGAEPRAAFHARDGTAIARLRQAGVRLAVLSGRDGSGLRGRFERLGIPDVRLGVKDKVTVLGELLAGWGLAASDVAMVGDDHIDVGAMRLVGFAIAPADAAPAVRAVAHWVTKACGGRGVLAEIADAWLAVDSAGPAVHVGDLRLSDDGALTLLAGLNVLETRDETLRVAAELQRAARTVGLGMVFKASFDKANRSAGRSFRGPGLELGLQWLAEVKRELGLPILTDVHSPEQCRAVAEVADLVQIPAFLVRQTDLVSAAAKTGRPLHLKKMQMMAPSEMRSVVDKAVEAGAEGVVLCERGTSFGYGNLVVDPLSFPQLAAFGWPVSFDVTHALQTPGSLGGATGGRGQWVEPLAMSAVAIGIAALFVEVHPDPARAPCDGGSALPLDRAEGLFRAVADLDSFVKTRRAVRLSDGP